MCKTHGFMLAKGKKKRIFLLRIKTSLSWDWFRWNCEQLGLKHSASEKNRIFSVTSSCHHHSVCFSPFYIIVITLLLDLSYSFYRVTWRSQCNYTKSTSFVNNWSTRMFLTCTFFLNVYDGLAVFVFSDMCKIFSSSLWKTIWDHNIPLQHF